MQTNHHVGRLTKAINLEYVGQNNETARARFGLAIPRSNGKNETDFIYYTAFGEGAKTLAKIGHEKGMVLELTFQEHTSKYTDRDGNQRSQNSKIVDDFHFWGESRMSQNSGNNKQVDHSNTQIQSSNETMAGELNTNTDATSKMFGQLGDFMDIDYSDPND